MHNTDQTDSLFSYLVANFFDTFLIFWLSFLTVGLFNFIDKTPSTQDIILPDAWMFIYEHIFLFSQWFIPILLVIFAINAFFQTKLIARVVQKVIHAWIFDSVAILSGALLGSIYLNQGHVFFLDIAIDGIINIILFAFAVYAASIATVSMVTYGVRRFFYPKNQPLILNDVV
jgi:hypothetical protein